jgi:peptidoglycan/xylan/chitin deacetylase (PgdA/CDA1 family)
MTLVPVLMYHAVGRPFDKRFRPWAVPPSLFAEHLAVIRESGYELIGLTEWASRKDGRRCAVLTFDDGYADFLEHALPTLVALGARATAYVVTGYVGDKARWLPFSAERSRPIMSWDDLQIVHGKGIEIGSHSHLHRELDTLPPWVAEDDVRTSRDVLIQHGFSPQSFCYPFGYSSRKVRDIVASAGFSNACVVGRGLADSEQDMLCVRRLIVDHNTAPESLLRRFSGPAVLPSARLRQAAQPTWRFTRRLRSAARGLTKAETQR